jgi:hypothetical protein
MKKTRKHGYGKISVLHYYIHTYTYIYIHISYNKNYLFLEHKNVTTRGIRKENKKFHYRPNQGLEHFVDFFFFFHFLASISTLKDKKYERNEEVVLVLVSLLVLI